MSSPVKTPNFFRAKPLFGLDIGNGSLKVMQVHSDYHESKAVHGKAPRLVGYGTANFDKTAIQDGVIVQPEVIAKAMQGLFKKHLIGDVTSRRVAMTIPAYRTFTRAIQLPELKPQELTDAISLEAEQYIPLPLEELYLDYQKVGHVKDQQEVLAVAVPRKIVDSYLDLARIAGLEVVLIETTMGASARLFSQDSQSDVPTVIIDFGSLSSDISIYSQTIVAASTVPGGGQIFTDSITEKLGVTAEEAGIIKTKYGLGRSKRQAEIQEALEPILAQIVREIRRMVRYYEERYSDAKPIAQIITLGGGANMPGLSEYLINALRLAVRHCDPWQYFNYKGLQLPTDADKPMYATAAGLSLAAPREVLL